uniref:Death domain-containing protein n=1 Tax=Ascaris lumbricoides TaxID=6252 RepID=A0A9J2P4A7_ASCLU
MEGVSVYDELKSTWKEAQDRRELQEKVDSLKKNIRKTEQKYASEMGKLRKDLLVSRELEKEAMKESRTEGAQLVPTKNQLSESSLELQRLKNALIAQTTDCNNKVVLVMECARKAEVRLLQLKLEIGLDILKHAYEDSERNISELQLKREQIARGRYYELMEGSIAAWRDRQRLIRELIVSAKNDFAVQVDQIKGGKQLANLPAISVAKPPPAPESFPLDGTYMQVPSTLEYRSSFAVTESPSCGGQEMSATASSSASDKRMLKGATTLSDVPLPMLRMHSWKDWFNVEPNRGSTDSSSSAVASINSSKSPLTHSWAPQPSNELGGEDCGNIWAYANGWSSGNDIWSNQQPAGTNIYSCLCLLQAIFSFTYSILGRYSEQGRTQQTSTYQQREPWSAGSERRSAVLPTAEDFADSTMGPSSRHGDEIIRHLRMHFPALSCLNREVYEPNQQEDASTMRTTVTLLEFWVKRDEKSENRMEYLKELMIRNGCNSLDGMTVRDVVTGVARLIVEKHA